MTIVSFAKKVKLTQRDAIMLYRGISIDGEIFFAYLRCNRHGVEKLHLDAMHNTPRDLSEYGEMIYMDFIADPDAAAEEFLANYLRELSHLAAA